MGGASHVDGTQLEPLMPPDITAMSNIPEHPRTMMHVHLFDLEHSLYRRWEAQLENFWYHQGG